MNVSSSAISKLGTTILVSLLSTLSVYSAESTPVQWEYNRMTIQRGPLYDVVHGKGIYISVSGYENNGQQSQIYLSHGLASWKDASLLGDNIPIIHPENGVDLAFGNDLFLLANNGLRYSKNGVIWFDINLSHLYPTETIPVSDVVYVGSIFVAWGDEDNGRLIYSDDGKTWNLMHDFGAPIREVIFNQTTNRWYVYSDNKVYKSFDAVNWEIILQGEYQLELLGGTSVFVEHDENATSSMAPAVRTLVCSDGETLTETAVELFRPGYTGYTRTYYSSGEYIRIRSIDPINAPDLKIIETSPDLENWTQRWEVEVKSAFPPYVFEQDLDADFQTVIYMQDGNLVLVKGRSWEGWGYSGNGYDYQEVSEMAFSDKRILNNRFVGINEHKILRSTDGARWYPIREIPETLIGIDFLTALDRFVVFYKNADETYTAAVSENGSHWTALHSTIPFIPFEITGNKDALIINGIQSDEILVSQDNGDTWTHSIQGINWHQPMGTSGPFNRAVLTVESLGENFVLIWDDKVYQSTDAINWQRVYDAQSDGAWFSYLESFNGQFIATTETDPLTDGHSSPRWEGTTLSNRLIYSTDGKNWTMAPNELDFAFAHRPRPYSENPIRWKRSQLGVSAGQTFYKFDRNGNTYVLDENFNLQRYPGESNNGPSERNTIFAQGRFHGVIINESPTIWKPGNDDNTTYLIKTPIRSEFIGFGDLKRDENGMKNTYWLGLVDDTDYPNIKHDVFGDLIFSIDPNDDIKMFSEKYGVIWTSLSDLPYFWVQPTNLYYLAHFHPAAKHKFYDHQSNEWTDTLSSESTDESAWIAHFDFFVSKVQRLAQDVETFASKKYWYLMDSASKYKNMQQAMNELNSFAVVLEGRWIDTDPNVASMIDEKLAVAQSAIDRAKAVFESE